MYIEHEDSQTLLLNYSFSILTDQSIVLLCFWFMENNPDGIDVTKWIGYHASAEVEKVLIMISCLTSWFTIF